MFTRVRYSPREVLRWTRWEIAFFLGYAAVLTALYVLADCRFLHLPWAPVAVVGTAVAFIVGFQNNAAYGRIWEARKIWGGIVNASRAWGMQVMDCVERDSPSRERDDAEAHAHRERLVHRHIAWLTALRHAMRQPRPWETFGECPVNQEWSSALHIPEREEDLKEELNRLLPTDEAEDVLKRTNPAAALLFNQSRHLRELKRVGLLWEFSFLEMQTTLQRLFDEQGKSERVKNFPYPRQYATVGYQFVRLFVLFIPLAALPEFAAIGAKIESAWPWIGQYFVWIAVPFSALMSWLFHVMERIGRSGENPFEGTVNDVPISTMARGIEIDLRQMLGESPRSIPGPVPTRLEAQM